MSRYRLPVDAVLLLFAALGLAEALSLAELAEKVSLWPVFSRRTAGPGDVFPGQTRG